MKHEELPEQRKIKTVPLVFAERAEIIAHEKDKYYGRSFGKSIDSGSLYRLFAALNKQVVFTNRAGETLCIRFAKRVIDCYPMRASIAARFNEQMILIDTT